MVIQASFRRKTIFGILGATLISCELLALKALALPTEQVLQKLNPVPVFTIADDKGTSLVASEEYEAKVTSVLISQRETANFETEMNRFRTEMDRAKKLNDRMLQEADAQTELERRINETERSRARMRYERMLGESKGQVNRPDPVTVNRNTEESSNNSTSSNTEEVLDDFGGWLKKHQERQRELNEVLMECVGWTC